MIACVCRDFLTAEDKEGVFNADHFPLWYKRAAEQVPGTFVYSIPFSSGMMIKHIKTRTCHKAYFEYKKTIQSEIVLLFGSFSVQI